MTTHEPRSIREIVLSTRWSSEDAETIFAALEKSRLSATNFADRHGFDVQRLYWWNRRLGRPAMRRGRREAFKEVVIEAVRVEQEDARLEIVLPRGLALRVPISFDERALRRVLKIVTEDGEC
jgi:hypothetical protein